MARLDRDLALAGDRLGGVRQQVQEDLVDLRAHALDGRQLVELPLHGHPVLQEMVQEREARLDLFVEVDGLPHVVVAAREHTQVPHDLARALRAFLDAEDHRVEVLERVVDLERRPLTVHPLALDLGQGHRAVDLEHLEGV